MPANLPKFLSMPKPRCICSGTLLLLSLSKIFFGLLCLYLTASLSGKFNISSAAVAAVTAFYLCDSLTSCKSCRTSSSV